jgi:excisionase family DNA binding protein
MTTTTIHAAPIAFSVGEVAELLGCSTDTVRRMISSSRLEAVQPLGKGGRVFVGRASIERLFDSAVEAAGNPVDRQASARHD